MAIDHELRKTGIGASEVAAVLGLSPYQTRFDLYCRKLDLVDQPKATAVQRRGHYFERGVAEWWSDISGRPVEWFDQTIRHQDREWQLSTPDAWILDDGRRDAELQVKTVNWRNVEDYGEPGSDDIPVHNVLQCQWTMSTTSTSYSIVAALLGMDELHSYTVYRDAEVEAVMLEQVEKFWREHVLARVPPDIDASDSAKRYLKKRFPKNVSPLRVATAQESSLLAKLKESTAAFKKVQSLKDILENQVKLAIGAGEGLLDGKDKVTFRLCADSVGPDWKAIAKDAMERLAIALEHLSIKDPTGQELLAIKHRPVANRDYVQMIQRAMVKEHTKVLKLGSRRLVKSFDKDSTVRSIE